MKDHFVILFICLDMGEERELVEFDDFKLNGFVCVSEVVVVSTDY